jgi:soluble lytic murein transglycosylase-like protein
MTFMKTLSLSVALILFSALSAHAQSGSAYRFDNFDFATGIKLETQPKQVPSPKQSRNKRGGAHHSASAAAINTIIDQKMTDIRVSNSLAGYTTGNSAVDSFIVDSGKRHSVDPLLLYSIMHQESTFKARALSNKGARGLMQLMPGTAVRFGVTSIWDPRQNIEGGTRYMRFLLDKFGGNVPLALAGYNAGEGAVMKYGNRIPPYNETQEYVRRISKRYALIRDPYAARLANSVTRDQIAGVQRKDSIPLTMYERSVFPVRLPDGRLQLISQ